MRLTTFKITLAVAGLLGAPLGISEVSAGNGSLTVSATVVSKNICKFNVPTSALAFGAINASTTVPATAATSIQFRCVGSAPIATFFISDDDGLYETGPDANRMRHGVILTEYLPYSLTLSPTSASVPKNVWQTLTISGSISVPSIQNAVAGAFSDTVVILINP